MNSRAQSSGRAATYAAGRSLVVSLCVLASMAASAADKPATASATVTVTVTVMPWAYATCLDICPHEITRRGSRLLNPCEPVSMAFDLPSFISPTLLRLDALTLNGTPISLWGTPLFCVTSTGTRCVLRFDRQAVNVLLGTTEGVHPLQLDVPLTSGHLVSCFGVVTLKVQGR